MNRAQSFEKLEHTAQFDVAIIGGGATGLGVALDASLRGYTVLLLESHDFAKGTSSRATKLVHGGVRYLAQGNISLVREALRERTSMLANAPHLANALPFVMPSYRRWETPFYGVGLKLYDLLAGKAGLGATRFLSREQTLNCLPSLRQDGLKGGVMYWDGQFDDARFALALAKTASAAGALVINYCEATQLQHDSGKVTGLVCRDVETGQIHAVNARCVINAAGVWVDQFRQLDGAALGRAASAMVAPSQGVHLVVDASFLPSRHALMVPKTADGRVLFAVPWLGQLVLGTTDTPRSDVVYEPKPLASEVDFILSESARYLTKPPVRADVKSIWVGLRPLVKPPEEDGHATKGISREHTVLVSRSGLVTVTGGKWTTYRAMAEDVLDRCIDAAILPPKVPCQTGSHALVGTGHEILEHVPISAAPGLHLYGEEAAQVESLPGHNVMLAMGLSEAMVRFAVRQEHARTVEDVLARRSRLLFLDAALAEKVADRVSEILQEEGIVAPQLDAFVALAHQYRTLPV